MRLHRTILLPVILLPACTTITTTLPDGSQRTRTIEQFEQYAESVFRRQNHAMTQAGMLLDEELTPKQYRELESAEANMLKACKPLNEIANRQIDRQDAGLSLELEAKHSIGDCDYATQKVEQLIKQLQ